MHKQTGILLTLPHTLSLSFSLSISVFRPLSFCLHLWHFFCLNKAHKFVLVVCATFLLRIFIMCLLLRFASVAKSMLHIFPPLSLGTLATPLITPNAQRKSLRLRLPGANFIIYSLTRRDDYNNNDNNMDYVALEG